MVQLETNQKIVGLRKNDTGKNPKYQEMGFKPPTFNPELLKFSLKYAV